MKGEKIFSGLELFFMELTLQEKLKLIEFFEFLLDEEISKPLGEMNSEAVDNYIKILLHLQDKHIELSSEFINDQVRKIFHKEENTAIPEAIKTTKKYFNKKKVWLVAACVAILVALFSIISVAYDWSVFDFLSEKFGSVHSAPIEEEQDFNGITVIMNGKNTNYSSIEDALKTEKIDILYPATLPNNIKVTDIMFSKDSTNTGVFFTFTDSELFLEVSCDKALSKTVKSGALQIQEINSITCYICEMPDINSYQINFEYKGDSYAFNHSNKKLLIEIIKNLEEINYEN